MIRTGILSTNSLDRQKSIKHYAIHTGPEAGRHGFDAKVSEKDLYETYLWAFKYCIDQADPSAVMGAYNRANGESCCES